MKKQLLSACLLFPLLTPVLAEERDIQIGVTAHTYVHVGDLNYEYNCKGEIGDIKQSMLPPDSFQSHHGKCWREMNKEINLKDTQLGTEAEYLNNKIHNAESKNIMVKGANHKVGRHKLNKLKYHIHGYTWGKGQSSVQMIKVDEGFCALRGVTGKFEGYGENVIVNSRNGYWYLEGSSVQSQLRAYATCIKFNW